MPLVPKIRHPENTTTPPVGVWGFVVQSRNPNPGWVLIDRVTEALDVVTMLPPLSSTVTAGCVVQVVPLVPPPGWVLNTSCVAAPKVMVSAFELTLAKPVAAAVSV